MKDGECTGTVSTKRLILVIKIRSIVFFFNLLLLVKLNYFKMVYIINTDTHAADVDDDSDNDTALNIIMSYLRSFHSPRWAQIYTSLVIFDVQYINRRRYINPIQNLCAINVREPSILLLFAILHLETKRQNV